jgi:hypothetical protein
MNRDQARVPLVSGNSMHAGLQTLGLRRRRFWLILVAAVPGIAMLTMLPGPLFPVLTAIWLAVIAIAGWHSQ